MKKIIIFSFLSLMLFGLSQTAVQAVPKSHGAAIGHRPMPQVHHTPPPMRHNYGHIHHKGHFGVSINYGYPTYSYGYYHVAPVVYPHVYSYYPVYGGAYAYPVVNPNYPYGGINAGLRVSI